MSDRPTDLPAALARIRELEDSLRTELTIRRALQKEVRELSEQLEGMARACRPVMHDYTGEDAA